jgi:regulator of replication initiation timing
VHGGFAEQTVAAAKWALAEIERLQAENERLIDEIKVLRVDNVMMRTRLERLDEKGTE